jgi:hypothetical protein
VGLECKILHVCVVLSSGITHYPTTRQRGPNEDHPITAVTPPTLTYFHRLHPEDSKLERQKRIGCMLAELKHRDRARGIALRA